MGHGLWTIGLLKPRPDCEGHDCRCFVSYSRRRRSELTSSWQESTGGPIGYSPWPIALRGGVECFLPTPPLPRTLMPRFLRLALFVCVLGALGATGLAQSPREVAGRLIGDYLLPAIDRGLRDVDPPRPPRRLTSGYLAGSVVVKFRAGT